MKHFKWLRHTSQAHLPCFAKGHSRVGGIPLRHMSWNIMGAAFQEGMWMSNELKALRSLRHRIRWAQLAPPSGKYPNGTHTSFSKLRQGSPLTDCAPVECEITDHATRCTALLDTQGKARLYWFHTSQKYSCKLLVQNSAFMMRLHDDRDYWAVHSRQGKHSSSHFWLASVALASAFRCGCYCYRFVALAPVRCLKSCPSGASEIVSVQCTHWTVISTW